MGLMQILQGDQREEHDSGQLVSVDYLTNLGIAYYQCLSIPAVDAIAMARSYKNRDEVTISPETMGAAYEDKMRTFFQEHLHEDEEIRYILDGQGYFDVRDEEDRWIRIKVEKYDLLILPAGIYHRFTTDSHNVGFHNQVTTLLDMEY
jgi:1,2-dihydroxy-3-keto-5-methylthiopentene dioxygenase